MAREAVVVLWLAVSVAAISRHDSNHPGPVSLDLGEGLSPKDEKKLVDAGDSEMCMSILEAAVQKNATYRPGHLGQHQDNPDVDKCVEAMRSKAARLAEEVADLTNKRIELLREEEIARLKPKAKKGDAVTTYPGQKISAAGSAKDPKDEEKEEEEAKYKEVKNWAKDQILVKLRSDGDEAVARLNAFLGGLAEKAEWDDSVMSSASSQSEVEDTTKKEREALEQALMKGDDSKQISTSNGNVKVEDYVTLDHLDEKGKQAVQPIIQQMAQESDITPKKVSDAVKFLKVNAASLSPQASKIGNLFNEQEALAKQAQTVQADAKDIDEKAKQAVEKLKLAEKQKIKEGEIADALTKEMPEAIKESVNKVKMQGSQQQKLKQQIKDNELKAKKKETKRISQAAKQEAEENDVAKPLSKAEEREQEQAEIKEVNQKSNAQKAGKIKAAKPAKAVGSATGSASKVSADAEDDENDDDDDRQSLKDSPDDSFVYTDDTHGGGF